MELQIGSGRAARLIAEQGALESPFVLVDIGVRGGIHPRWAAFESALEVYGFDAIAEVHPPNERHHYFKLAIGDFDGESLFDVPENRYEARISSAGSVLVPIAKLDTLWSNKSLPTADFIKIDCEGYEPEVLRGAARYLAASNILGADVETNFNISPTLPGSHFVGIAEPLIAQRLLVADLAFGTASFPSKLPWPGTCNVLFTRHFINERDHQKNYVIRNPDVSPTADEILKTIAIFDLYSLRGPARALLTRFRDVIDCRVDAAALLECLPPDQGYAFERFIPHLGLGLWSGAKRLLGLTKGRSRLNRTLSL
jgi:FkbM family methyltransferase